MNTRYEGLAIQYSQCEQISLQQGGLEFSALACGLKENAGRPLVICLHGFPDSSRGFRLQLPVLANAGYRVIAPTLRGYQTSSQPENQDYSFLTLARDVVAWIDHFGEQQVHLIGHDWGGAITFVAGALAPERFLSLTAITAPHSARAINIVRNVPRQVLLSWYMTFFQLRGISDAVVKRSDWSLLRKLWKNWSPGYDLPESEWELLREQFAQPGVVKATLSYYRQNASPGVFLGCRRLGLENLQSVPVRSLAIVGRDDGCFDHRIYDYIYPEEDFPRGIRVEIVENAGHFPHQEKPAEINSVLLDWLGEAK